MRRLLLFALPCLAAALLSLPVLAQHGHPLVGSWHGNWGPNAQQRNDLTVIFFYDGKTISGMINPGLDVAKFTGATLDPSKWAVHVDTQVKDKSGAMVKVTVDGVMDDVVNPARTMSGTWTQGGVKGDFKLTRDN